MKKLIAIVLLSLLLFNLAGYRIFFDYLEQEHRSSLVAKLNNSEYNATELLELKIPLSMPYITIQSNFERVDGEITVNGRLYKYVKRKVMNGQMILLCLRDDRQVSINHARSEFANQTNDIPISPKKNAESIKKIFVSEFEETIKQSFTTSLVFYLPVQVQYVTSTLSPGFLGYADKPPENFFS